MLCRQVATNERHAGWPSGYKMSGHGRENGLEGLRQFLHTKSVWVEMSGATRDPFKLG